jgi:hypothetical protein
MATTLHIRLAAGVLALAAALVPAAHAAATRSLDADEIELIGNSGHVPDSKKPKLTAFFPRESYPRGGTAQLIVTDTAPDVSLQVFRAGDEAIPTVPNDVMLGVPVTRARDLGYVRGRGTFTLRLGDWPSGVYFARVRSGDRIGYAPFVLAPRRLGENRIAVVMPTQTWQAYNFRDDDGDGRPDTWYWSGNHARLGRPFLNRGVPNHFKYYDMPFLQWLYQSHRDVDVLSDADLNATSGERLRAAYKLIVFPGHHEYVTTHEFDAIQRYRDLGGHLMWLSANNFFWKITIKGDVMTRVVKWRDIGRPESALIGVQYFRNDMGEHRGPWIVRKTESTSWIFAGTGLKDGDGFSSGGIEADCITPASPRGTQVIAEIPNLYGPGQTADMTLYELPNGAKAFAAGAFSLADSIMNPQVQRLVTNLWENFSR